MTKHSLVTPQAVAAEKSLHWQLRRARLLQAACNLAAILIAGGANTTQALRSAASKFRGRSLGGGRSLALSKGTMRRHWYSGKRRESDFIIRYVAGKPAVNIDPLLLQLVCAASVSQSKTVHEIIASAAAGAGNRAEHPSLGTICRALPSAAIRRFLAAERRLIARRKRCEDRLRVIDSRLQKLRKNAGQEFSLEGEFERGAPNG